MYTYDAPPMWPEAGQFFYGSFFPFFLTLFFSFSIASLEMSIAINLCKARLPRK